MEESNTALRWCLQSFINKNESIRPGFPCLGAIQICTETVSSYKKLKPDQAERICNEFCMVTPNLFRSELTSVEPTLKKAEKRKTRDNSQLRSEMAGLAAFVHRAGKRSKDQIQTKIAAELKLCRDIKKSGKFELKAWQIAAAPLGLHISCCDECAADSDPFDRSQPPSVRLKYPEGIGLPQASQEDAYPQIKLEDEGSGSLGRFIAPIHPRAARSNVKTETKALIDQCVLRERTWSASRSWQMAREQSAHTCWIGWSPLMRR